MSDNRLMKDGLNHAALERIATALDTVIPDFRATDFIAQAHQDLEKLELKQRVQHIIAVLADYLPGDFPTCAHYLQQLPAVWDQGEADDALRGFAIWPITDYVGVHGLQHPQEALQTLKVLTPFFSAEFAIRPFIEQQFDATYPILQQWCGDPDEHVRRLVSEGTRPRLPWGPQLKTFIHDPSPVMPLLEQLKDDPSEYVRRSVANHLNDISKDHPETMLDVCERWNNDASEQRRWIIKHASRSLIKQGHRRAFPLQGYDLNPQLHVHPLNLSHPILSLGQQLEFDVTITSTASYPQSFVVDYAIHHVKANQTTSAKVFKFKSLKLAAGESISLQKKHSFKPISTRKYYSGEHAVELLINGEGVLKQSFILQV